MEPLLSWLGLALAALGPLSYLVWTRITKPAQTTLHPVEYSVVCGLGVAITMAVSWRHGDAAGWIHAWAGLSLIGWVVYLRWYRPRIG
ncbi:MAG: hypothetical protein GWM87_03425 [Xanthomonadales bacterium]|nr:hypothetical protein [Xanthomonadales bacterium]NIX12089.1 hypothetical protein [Xanthomonadales bacterium]